MNRNKFTLVELLVVVGLISLLLGLVVPAFGRMMSGNKVADAASNLKLGLEQAQSYAVSRRAYVALILPNKSAAETAGTAKEDADEQSALLGGFRLAEIEKPDRNTTSFIFKQWIEDFPWKPRTEGAVLAYASDKAPDTSDEGTVLTEKIATNGDVKTEISFDKLGELTNIPVTDSAGDSHSETTGEGGETDTRKGCAVVFSPYGGCFGGTTYYFTVVEGSVNDDYLELAGEAQKKTNFITLRVNGYTGRVEYYDYEKDNSNNTDN